MVHNLIHKLCERCKVTIECFSCDIECIAVALRRLNKGCSCTAEAYTACPDIHSIGQLNEAVLFRAYGA